MARIALIIYIDPGALEITCNLRTLDGALTRLSAYVDTDAAVSLFPLYLLERLKHTLVRGPFIIQQDGIAEQEFEAIEAFVEIVFEDGQGTETRPYEIRAWFAETEEALIGFDGVLDRVVLYANLRDGREAWLELDDA